MSVTETGKTCVSWADPDYIYSGDDLNDFARKSSSYSVINRFRYRHTDTQTERQTDIQTDIQADRQRHTDKQTYRETDRQTD